MSHFEWCYGVPRAEERERQLGVVGEALCGESDRRSIADWLPKSWFNEIPVLDHDPPRG